jgi:hypothetical protein
MNVLLTIAANMPQEIGAKVSSGWLVPAALGAAAIGAAAMHLKMKAVPRGTRLSSFMTPEHAWLSPGIGEDKLSMNAYPGDEGRFQELSVDQMDWDMDLPRSVGSLYLDRQTGRVSPTGPNGEWEWTGSLDPHEAARMMEQNLVMECQP